MLCFSIRGKLHKIEMKLVNLANFVFVMKSENFDCLLSRATGEYFKIVINATIGYANLR